MSEFGNVAEYKGIIRKSIYVPHLYCQVTNHPKTSWLKITIALYYLSWFLYILDSGRDQLGFFQGFSYGCSQRVDGTGTVGG